MIKEAKFISSCDNYLKAPAANKPEYAFIGRSNVGKSSLINMLTNQKKLAKTSSTPGKTQLINYFEVNDTWYLVDLPGYGFAKASKEMRGKWDLMVWNYLTSRESLCCVFLLIDIRLEAQKSDLQMITNLGENGIPFAIVFTKADKLKPNEMMRNVALYKQILKQNWEELPIMFITSAESMRGKDDLLGYIESINNG